MVLIIVQNSTTWRFQAHPNLRNPSASPFELIWGHELESSILTLWCTDFLAHFLFNNEKDTLPTIFRINNKTNEFLRNKAYFEKSLFYIFPSSGGGDAWWMMLPRYSHEFATSYKTIKFALANQLLRDNEKF